MRKKRFFIIAVLLVPVYFILTPVYMSQSDYGKNEQELPNLEATVSTHVSVIDSSFTYYLLFAAFINKADGNIEFNFSSKNNDMSALDIKSVSVGTQKERYDIQNENSHFPLNDIERVYCDNNKVLFKEASFSFEYPEDVVDDNFSLKIEGDVIDRQGVAHPFVYNREIEKTPYVSVWPAFLVYYSLIMTI